MCVKNTILFEQHRPGDYGEDGSLWTLVMTNPDGHFEEDEAEYLHWMVANIPCKEGVADASSGETICPYLQTFPPFGTGFHRFIFVLYKQVQLQYYNLCF